MLSKQGSEQEFKRWNIVRAPVTEPQSSSGILMLLVKLTIIIVLICLIAGLPDRPLGIH